MHRVLKSRAEVTECAPSPFATTEPKRNKSQCERVSNLIEFVVVNNEMNVLTSGPTANLSLERLCFGLQDNTSHVQPNGAVRH